MPTEAEKYSAQARIDRMGTIFYGKREPAYVVERVLADYAMTGSKVGIGELAKRAKARLQKAEKDSEA